MHHQRKRKNAILRNCIFLVCCFVFCLQSICKAQVSSVFTIGIEKAIPSKILSEERKVWIHLPNNNFNSGTATGERYPVIYVLDGGENFKTVVSILEHMVESSLCPPSIVVGILHANRLTELTTGSDKELPGVLGNGENFLAFVEKELIPFVDSSHPTSSFRTLIGHSLGGLTVINTLLHRSSLFSAYASLDASLWWNDQNAVRAAREILPVQSYQGKVLYMAMANRLEKGMDTASVQKDTTGSTELIRSNLAFIREIGRNKSNGLRFQHRFYEDDDHPSVRMIGEYDALRFIFNFYKLRIYDSQLADRDFRLDSLLVAHYKVVSENMGYLIPPDERLVNRLGYQMMAGGQPSKAENLFKLNVANNPSSANCYDSLGDLYMTTGENAKAIQSFKKALSITEIPETRQKLVKLESASLR